MAPAARLIAVGVFAAPREIPLSAFPLRLGRSTTAHVFVNDRWVSRDHCEIDWVNDALVVRDLGSKHGTFVNGQAVATTELRSGDELTIGLSKFLVQLDRPAPATATHPQGVLVEAGAGH
jgi:pSer/pThr/pTyr-binding forkhead associated (FHA) protein